MSPRKARPDVGGTTPVNTFSSVVLPAPFGPIMPVISDLLMVNVVPSSAMKPPNCTTTSSTRISWGASSAMGRATNAGASPSLLRRQRENSALSSSQSCSSPFARKIMKPIIDKPRNSRESPGRNKIGRASTSVLARKRVSSLPTVISTTPVIAPVTELRPPTISIVRVNSVNSKKKKRGVMLPSSKTRRDAPTATTTMDTASANV